MKNIIRMLSIVLLCILPLILISPNFIEIESKIEVVECFDVPKKEIFEYFSDLKKFNEWNFWKNKDLLTQIYYFSPYKGEKSSLQWKSPYNEIGSGTYRIKKIVNNQTIEAEFIFDTIESSVYSSIQFKELSDKQTEVIWSFILPQAFYFGKIYNFYIKKDIENKVRFGFSNLKKHFFLTKN